MRTCFDLGVWFHRAVTGEPFLQGFVPPPDPAAQAQATSAERAELQELRQELARQRERLAEVKVHRDGQISRLEADARAHRQAEEELARALADRQELRSLVEQTQQRLAEAETRFTADMERAQRVKAVQRDAFIARAQQAAAEPLTEAEVRERVDEMLRLAGWAIQNANATNLFAADGVAVREIATAEGVADYLLYVDQKLAGVVEAKREGTILSPVEVQSSRYAGSLTAAQQFAAWRIPLPFRYETTAVETHLHQYARSGAARPPGVLLPPAADAGPLDARGRRRSRGPHLPGPPPRTSAAGHPRPARRPDSGDQPSPDPDNGAGRHHSLQ